MNFLIRRATLDDVSVCAQIHIQAWQETYRGIIPDSYLDIVDLSKRASMWKKIIENKNIFNFVAEIEEVGVVGYLTGGKNRSSFFPDYGEIMGIYLLKEYHHKGIGQTLFNFGLRVLRENGYKKVSLWVLKENSTCIFYSKMKGYTDKEQEIEIAGKKLLEIAYIWNEIIHQNIFHITSFSEWEKAKNQGYYEHPSLLKEGFIHCSSIHQVHRVANIWYKEYLHPVVLEVDPSKLKCELKYESGGNQEDFPHVYGRIPIESVVQIKELIKAANGNFTRLR